MLKINQLLDKLEKKWFLNEIKKSLIQNYEQFLKLRIL